MAKGSKTQTFTPEGQAEQRELLKSQQNLYNQLLAEVKPSQMYVTSPEFQDQLNRTLQSQKEAGFKTLNEYYQPQYRTQRQNVTARFGGVNTSVARDLANRIGQQEQKSVADLANQIEQSRYNLEGQQLQRQQLPLANLLGEGAQYSNTIQLAPKFATVTQTTPYRTFGEKLFDPWGYFT